eukprot:TRINITY_DN2480_c0_g1_i3.p1 TRINITY_DN2480_c0_g1~~TRINITY_DN2480_c0_g1_i3.p1  ORF type:complete len:253 (+),score=26.20 TRINITY_DN2480_c0_g1_i3:59-817(+)
MSLRSRLETFKQNGFKDFHLLVELPFEVCVQILSQVDVKQLGRLILVSKSHRDLVENNEIWYRLVSMNFPRSFKSAIDEADKNCQDFIDWRENYLYYENNENMCKLIDTLDFSAFKSDKDVDFDGNWIEFSSLIVHLLCSSNKKTSHIVHYSHYTFCDDETLFLSVKLAWKWIMENGECDYRLIALRIANFLKTWLLDTEVWHPVDSLDKSSLEFLAEASENQSFGQYFRLITKRINDLEDSDDVVTYICIP